MDVQTTLTYLLVITNTVGLALFVVQRFIISDLNKAIDAMKAREERLYELNSRYRKQVESLSMSNHRLADIINNLKEAYSENSKH